MAEVERFSIGDRVVINSGKFIGEIGTIVDFELIDSEVFVMIDLDSRNDLGAAVSIEQIDAYTDGQKVVNILNHGMSADDTASAVQAVMMYCMSRIKGVGQEQYGQGTSQQFESMSLPDLIEYQLEEIADDINYAVFRFIRLRRIQEALKEKL